MQIKAMRFFKATFFIKSSILRGFKHLLPPPLIACSLFLSVNLFVSFKHKAYILQATIDTIFRTPTLFLDDLIYQKAAGKNQLKRHFGGQMTSPNK